MQIKTVGMVAAGALVVALAGCQCRNPRAGVVARGIRRGLPQAGGTLSAIKQEPPHFTQERAHIASFRLLAQNVIKRDQCCERTALNPHATCRINLRFAHIDANDTRPVSFAETADRRKRGTRAEFDHHEPLHRWNPALQARLLLVGSPR